MLLAKKEKACSSEKCTPHKFTNQVVGIENDFEANLFIDEVSA